eukprot:164242-Pyramimonas_sp.AAC.1
MMRRRPSVNPRVINEDEVNPPPKLHIHRPLHRFMSIDGTASLADNRLQTLKHAETLFSGFQCHGST